MASSLLHFGTANKVLDNCYEFFAQFIQSNCKDNYYVEKQQHEWRITTFLYLADKIILLTY